MTDNNKRNGFAAKIFIAGAVLCILAGGAALYRSRSAGNYRDIQEKAESASEGITETEAAAPLEESVETAAENDTASAAETAATAQTAAPAEEIPIDFESVQEECPDVYAWIHIDNTQIDYPVCQSPEGEDQNFYLSHRADGTAEFAGSIYSQDFNAKDFSDPNTVLYGHDMSNGSMFQNLHFYENSAFRDENSEVLIYLPDKVLHYKVFAAYNTTDDHILVKFDCFKDPEVFKQYLQDVKAGTYMYSGYVDENVELTENSRILTLSTCNNVDDQRFIVQCVLQ